MTSLYKQSVPVFIKYLENFAAFLDKGKAFADEKSIKHEEIISFRLAADMRGQVAQKGLPETGGLTSTARPDHSDDAKFLVARVGGAENIFFEDDEKTFDELQVRITKTIELLKSVDAKGFEGKEDEKVVMETKMGTFGFTGQRYVSEFAIPNFHFHLSTAYCILRSQGVPLGAFDYMKDVFEKV